MKAATLLLRSAISRLTWWVAAALCLIAVNTFLIGNTLVVQASEPIEVGYRDFSYPSGTGANSEVTAEKPESKLWWNDGFWWGSLWSTSGNAYHIYRLDWTTQTWVDTGTVLDDRSDTKADTLWDGQYLYVVSHIWSGQGESTPAGQRGELFRYSYNSTTKTYTLDSGFPVEVTGGKSETLVLAKDSTGMLWVTYTQKDDADGIDKVWVNHSRNGDDIDWGTPVVLPVGSSADVTDDDISSIIAFDGHIGLMWSSQSGGKQMHFAVHTDGDGDAATDWQSIAAYTASGDDHINLKSLQADSAGSVFAVIKTSSSAALIVVLACTSGTCMSAGDWSAHTVYTNDGTSSPTRPILLIDTSNRDLYVFARIKKDGVNGSNGNIYYKTADMDNIQFPAGLGLPFIKGQDEAPSDPVLGLNDPTSTKQNLNSTTGLVVLASDSKARLYYHNCLTLTGSANGCLDPNAPPTVAFSDPAYNVNENAGTATITVNLSYPSDKTITVNYATGDGTATAGSDYTAISDTLTFAPYETSQSFDVSISNDTLDESNETINLTLSNPTNASLGTPASAALTILDNDPAPTVAFSASAYNVNEDAPSGTAIIEVTLSAASELTATVQYATSDGTATAADDYTTASNSLTFNPGQTSRTFEIAINDDASDEPNETVNLTLSNPTNASLGTPASATLTILDNDPAPAPGERKIYLPLILRN